MQLICYSIIRISEAHCSENKFLLDFYSFITMSPLNTIETIHHLSMQLFYYFIIRKSEAYCCAKDKFSLDFHINKKLSGKFQLLHIKRERRNIMNVVIL